MLKWLIVIHILAIMAVFLSALSWYYQSAICLFVIISFRLYLRGVNYVGSLRHSTLMGWEWLDQAHDFYPIEVLSSSVITPLLMVVHFKRQNHKKKAIIVCRDSLSENEYRQLLVTLKINKTN